MGTGGFFRDPGGRQERRRSEEEQAQRRHCPTSPAGRRGPGQRGQGSAAVSRAEPRDPAPHGARHRVRPNVEKVTHVSSFVTGLTVPYHI